MAHMSILPRTFIRSVGFSEGWSWCMGTARDANKQARNWVWLKMKELGLRRFWSSVPFAKGAMLVHVFELQPIEQANKRASKANHWINRCSRGLDDAMAYASVRRLT